MEINMELKRPKTRRRRDTGGEGLRKLAPGRTAVGSGRRGLEPVEKFPALACVQHVLRFGGKIEHKASKFPIGVFGFGLSQTATCLTTRTMVFSKVEGGRWRSCEYSFEHLKREDAMLPPEGNETPTSLPTHSIALQLVVVQNGQQQEL